MEDKMKTMHYRIFKNATAMLLGILFIAMAVQSHADDQKALVEKARITFESFMADPNMAWLKENLHTAKGLVIVPSLLKAGFIFGGSGGSGVLIVPDAKTGKWSEPAFYTIGSVSFGLQIGGEAAEIIIYARTQKAVDKMLTSSVKLGGDTSVSVGPVGAGVKSNVMADMFSFSRSKGAFAGLALDGAVVATRDEWNENYYGKPVTPVDILVKGTVSNPNSAALRNAVTKAAKK
jgi:lipid-binding SYLF domain-containing protein